uniref:NIF3-like protein 1 n=1 Tax=Strigamia maritima TaxID=126957 RepID=T1J2P1_STRMM
MRLLVYLQFVKLTGFHRFCSSLNRITTPETSIKMNLSDVVSQLNRLAPPSLAEKWDNVGLLVEPSAPHHVEKMLLTNDLTENVLKEALDLKVNLILSYHPPIFAPLKRITSANWKERIVVRCLENRIAVYSPHTSFDASSDGVNSWLTEAFDVADCKPISPSISTSTPSGFSHKVEALIPSSVANNPEVNKVLEKLELIMQRPESQNEMEVNFRSTELCPCILTVLCTEAKLPEIAAVLTSCSQLTKHTQIYKQDKFPIPGHGMGRVCNLKNPISINDAVRLVKHHLNLNFLRVASGVNKI